MRIKFSKTRRDVFECGIPKTDLALIDSLVSLGDILDQQPEVIWKLEVNRIPQIRYKCVCANGQQL